MTRDEEKARAHMAGVLSGDLTEKTTVRIDGSVTVRAEVLIDALRAAYPNLMIGDRAVLFVDGNRIDAMDEIVLAWTRERPGPT